MTSDILTSTVLTNTSQYDERTPVKEMMQEV